MKGACRLVPELASWLAEGQGLKARGDDVSPETELILNNCSYSYSYSLGPGARGDDVSSETELILDTYSYSYS